MSDCTSIDPLITPYVDGDIDAAARLRVDDHVRGHERLAEADVVAGEGLHEPDAATPGILLGVPGGDDHLVRAGFQEPVHHLPPDEPGAARDHDAHGPTLRRRRERRPLRGETAGPPQ